MAVLSVLRWRAELGGLTVLRLLPVGRRLSVRGLLSLRRRPVRRLPVRWLSVR
ncbi:hypothetical protein AB0C27_03515 [Nonomuraea sp. NPDC048882]|uniref:hypothetical protein n=1 Tax=unclassified Nonomuraea TaxID=2593643 RepID=UPI0033C7C742